MRPLHEPARRFRDLPLFSRAGRYALGVGTALTAPFHLRRASLERLLRPPLPATTADFHPDLAVRAGLRTLRLLARFRTPWYRNTCLFRAVVECRIARRYGHAAVLRIGVRSEAEGPSSIAAHAWVEYPGRALPGDADEYRTFELDRPPPSGIEKA